MLMQTTSFSEAHSLQFKTVSLNGLMHYVLFAALVTALRLLLYKFHLFFSLMMPPVLGDLNFCLVTYSNVTVTKSE